MNYHISITIIILLAGVVGPVSGQDRLPVREYTNPNETVALDDRVPFQDALSVIEELSEEFRGQIIIDRSGFTGEIGVAIPQLHWYDALTRITSYNDLAIHEEERFIEITRPEEVEDEPEDAAQVLDEEDIIDFNTREVEIKATFFDANRQTIRELGIDWSTLHNGKVQVDHIAAARVTDEALRVEVNWDDVASTGWDISALFNTLESSNLGEVISSPTIKVMERETGRIQVGQDFSIRQRDFAGNVIDQFFSTGTILEVTPEILYHEGNPYIYLSVEAERSTAAPGPETTIVNKQEASTEVLMLSGESTVIAGLYETEENNVRRGIPILKDLPRWFFGLRYLFGYSSTSYSVQELVVVLEVSLVPTLQERLDGSFENLPALIDQTRRDMHEMMQE